MTNNAWMAVGLLGSLLALISWFIQRTLARSENKIDKLGKEMTAQGKEHGAALMKIELGLTNCVKWSDLDKELDPMRDDIKCHEKRLTVIETECKANHNPRGSK